jgi:hypothetical protein
MKLCDCGNEIPNWAKIDGKMRNLSNRVKCLKCLPFNSGRYSKKSVEEKRTEKALSSKQYYEKKKAENGIDPVKQRRIKRKQLLVNLIGGCQICGYNKCNDAIDLHHLHNKQFEVSSRSLQFSFERVIRELAKCVMVCKNCHSEIHSSNGVKDDLNKLNNDLNIKMSQLSKEDW